VTTQERLLEEAKGKNAELKQKLEEVRSVEYLEKEARENLNMQLPGETVVMIPAGKIEKKRIEDRKVGEEPNWKKWVRLIF
jgi:cell division protein FtsB